MGLVDTHAHLETFARRGELNAVLERARIAGLEGVITIGTSVDDWDLYRGIAQANPGFVDCTVGLHPCSVGEDWPAQLARIEFYWAETASPRPVALGETGLDRFHLPTDRAEADRVFSRQRDVFAESLRIARKLATRVVVHSRGAFQECMEMVDASGVDWSRVVFHCFVEGPAEIEALNERGGRGSFTGVLTYKNAENVRAALKRQGLQRLMLETDAPYLAPVPHRGKGNEPALLAHTAAIAAEVLGVSPEDLARQSTQTAREFFGIQAMKSIP
ncbi:MAG: TatD family hydrolase [Opitutaceae bacterium]|nr:TatD family hydrolase [Opitutaceae bacterium]